MLQLKKNIPFEAEIAVMPDQHGVESLIICVKATFSLNGRVEIADEQLPIFHKDEFWGEPGRSSLKFASEAHLPKPATDIILVGFAQSPARRPVQQLDVMLGAGTLQKEVRVYGDRVWESSKATLPVPFRTMPLVYEKAYGGSHETGEEVLFEPRNPVGRGFVGRRKNEELENFKLPNIEDPRHQIHHITDTVPPVGFGFIAPSWQPRLKYAGTYDQQWQKRRAPYLPEDFDIRFFNAAHPDLIYNGYLQGGEPVRAVNASPYGPVEFNLPICRMKAVVDIAGNKQVPALNLETLMLEPESLRFSLLWRAIVACDKQALKIEQVDLDLQHLELGM